MGILKAKYLKKATGKILAVILLVSGVMKIIDPLTFIESIKALRIIPESLILFTATIFPLFEIALGIAVFTEYKLQLIKSITLILFTIFFAVSIYGYAKGLENECGCFGQVISSKYGIGMIIRNLILLLIATGYFKINSCRNDLLT